MQKTEFKNVFGDVTHHTEQGLRNYQEDRYVYSEFAIGYLMAVFDGHNGSSAADEASRNLPRIFDDEFKRLISDKKTPVNYRLLLKNVTTKIAKLVSNMRSGSTMSLVFIPKIFMKREPEAYIAVIGDSPVIIGKTSDKDIFIGPNHNVRENLKEREAAIARGGFFYRNYIWNQSGKSGLQMSRDLGNCNFGSVLIDKPEIVSTPISDKSILIVASDGVFDPAHEKNVAEQAKKFISMVEAGKEARDLIEDALERETGDNTTAIVFRITIK